MSSPVVQSIRGSGRGVVDYVFNGTCDMAFSKAPSVVMGPGRSERSHAADEFIRASEINDAIDIYVATLKTYFA